MTHVQLSNVGVEFRLLSSRDKSFRSGIVQAATGGRLFRDSKGGVQVQALHSVNLQLVSGEKLGILGHNGSGKSTLLRVFTRVLTPTTGSALISGTVGSLVDVSLGMNPEETGRNNVYLRGALLGLSKTTMDKYFDDIVAFAGLGDFIEMPLRSYSTGMQLRLSFAVSTISAPEILVMDEWLSVGDEQFRQAAQERLSQIVAMSKILIIASHSRELLERVCTRGVVLRGGRIERDGPIDEVTEYYFGAKP